MTAAAQSLCQNIFEGASYSNSIEYKGLLQALFSLTTVHPIFGSSARRPKGQPLSWHIYHLPPNTMNVTTYLCAREIVWICLYSCYNLTQNYTIGEHIRLGGKNK